MTTILLARTSHEAHLHMDLVPCSCGAYRFERSSAVVTLPDGELGRRYTGRCPECGADREFVYRLPAEPLAAGDGIVYGGEEPSQLVDAGQWLWVAEQYARAVPAGPDRLPRNERRQARGRLSAAVAALAEVLKFVPAGSTEVPRWAVWTPFGGQVRDSEPGRLDVGRLRAVQASYEETLRVIDAADRPALHGDRDGRGRTIQAARADWAARHDIDDAEWTIEGAAGPQRKAPTAEQADELMRTIRQLSGQDPATGLSLGNPYSGMSAYHRILRAVHRRWDADPAELHARLARVESAAEAWRQRSGFDDRRWHEEVRETPERDVPGADQVWDLVRAARVAAGQDPVRGDFVA